MGHRFGSSGKSSQLCLRFGYFLNYPKSIRAQGFWLRENENGNEEPKKGNRKGGNQSMDESKRKRALDPDSENLVPVDITGPNVSVVTADIPRRRKRLTSVVWNDFDKIMKDGVEMAVCKYCEKEFSGSSSSGTTHLNNHLKRCPRRFNTDLRQWMVVTTEKKREGAISLRGMKYDEKRSQMELVKMIIYHEYPFSVVEHVGFRRFISSLCPSFNMISCSTITDDCMVLYENEKKKVYDVLDRLSCRVNLTLDTWNSYQRTGFLCLTVHYLDDDWQLKKKIINFMQVEGCHTGELLANFLMKQITDWNIHHKLFSLTLDNAYVGDAANMEIKNRLCQSKLLLSDGQFFHVQCAACVINSIVKSVFEGSQTVIGNIREIIKIVSSIRHQQLFDSVIEKLQVNSKKVLHLDNTRQWDFTYSMLKVALEYKDALLEFQSHIPEFTGILSEEQWEEVASVCNCLKIFYDVTKLLSSTHHPTANMFFEEFCEIKLQIVEWLNSSDEMTKSIASLMKEKFDNYWEKCNRTLAVASVLDPRYKMKLVECYYPQIYGSSSECHIKEVVDTFKTLYEEYAFRSTSSSFNSALIEGAENIGSTGVAGNLKPDNGDDSRDKLRRFDRFLQENILHSQHLKTDIDEFLDEGVLPRDKDKSFNVWDWWKGNAAKYPVLSKMARDVLAISVSTVTSDSAFSLESRLLDAYRSSLNLETIQALICMQDWLKDEMGGAVSSVGDSVHSTMDTTTCAPEWTSFEFS